MKRAITLGLLMLIGVLSLALNAAQQPAGTQSMVVEVEKLKPGDVVDVQVFGSWGS